MQRILGISVTLLLVLTSLGYSGSAHFVSCSPAVNGDEVCVQGKEAGLGNLEQVDIHLEVVAHCQNRGGKDPSAANKESFSTDAVAPVQNGKALYEVCVTTSFKPECSPPMTVVVDTVALFDQTNGVSCNVSLQ